MDVRVHLTVPSRAQPVTGTLTARGDWGGSASRPTALVPGDNVVTLSMAASASQVRLWWPAGAGPQPLYNISVSFLPTSAAPARAIEAVRRVGFRVFALVTG